MSVNRNFPFARANESWRAPGHQARGRRKRNAAR